MFFNSLLLSFLAASSVLAGSNKESADWLKENSSKEGVVSLPSGLQYKIQKSGSGKLHPTVDSPCECHYKGTLIDGTQFDSSYDRGEPTTFAPNQVIAGWTEAMQLMVEGDKWELYIPSDIGKTLKHFKIKRIVPFSNSNQTFKIIQRMVIKVALQKLGVATPWSLPWSC